MRRLLTPALFLLATSAIAQNALWIDLNGTWRGADGDRPEFSSPNFDDSAWSLIDVYANVYRQANYWLRYRTTLPDGTDASRLAITLGARPEAYELYVNGIRVGATGSLKSFAVSSLPRPRTFQIPPDAVTDKNLLIALRVRSGFFMPPGWRIHDTGPYRITYAEHAPIEAGSQAIARQWTMQSPILMFASAFFVIGILSLLAWRMEPSRRELFWFACIALHRVIAALVEMSLLSEHSHPFSSNGVSSWQLLVDTLQYPLFGQFVLAALGLRDRRLAWLLWGGWFLEPVMVWGDNFRIGTYGGNIWANVFVVGIILWDWRRTWLRRAGFEAHALRASMLLFPLFWAYFWTTQAIRPFNVIGMTFGVHQLEIRNADLAWLVLSATIMTLLLRRLAADRREALRLSGELEAARTIQDVLIAKSSPGTATLPVQSAYYPAFEVGGDFFQVIPMRDGGLLIAVGDVSGKGLRAAMVVSLLTGALRNRTSDQPGALLGELNRVAAESLDGGFVTATIARCAPDGRLTIASAGHPAPYLNGEEIEIEPGLPLGLDSAAEYANRDFIFIAGRQLTFISDGVLEAANSAGELFGFQRTANMAAQSAHEIADAARAWGQNDDITVVTVRRNAA